MLLIFVPAVHGLALFHQRAVPARPRYLLAHCGGQGDLGNRSISSLGQSLPYLFWTSLDRKRMAVPNHIIPGSPRRRMDAPDLACRILALARRLSAVFFPFSAHQQYACVYYSPRVADPLD